MSFNNYKLEVISKHKDFFNRPLRKYAVDGVDHVGVWGNEPFAIRFKNNTYQRVQVRLSLDGTDILTTEPATVSPTGKMWMVEANRTLELEAWPETNEAGARFVFATEGNSVALHTHGDVSQKGIIAAAVYTEAYVAPRPMYRGEVFKGVDNDDMRLLSSRSRSNGGFEASMDLGRERSLAFDEIGEAKSAVPAAAIGAGETVKQAIGTTTGLRTPKLSEVISFNYLWWDELQEKLRAVKSAASRPSGFKDYVIEPEQMANLGSTPRVSTQGSQKLATDTRIFERIL